MKKLLSVLSVFAFAAIAAGTASASSIIVTPTGLVAGDQFRTIFVTSATSSGISSDLSTYDSVVTTDANGATYNGVVINWKAIVSNSTTSASDHIGLTSASTVPIYLVDGSLVSTGNLWSGSLLSAVNLGITGAEIEGQYVWTGTLANGTISAGKALGASEVRTGRLDRSNSEWIDHGEASQDNDHFKVYGISDVLTVPSAVPEPSTVMLAGLGGLAALAYSFKRKRN